jgi:hypothetical protein
VFLSPNAEIIRPKVNLHYVQATNAINSSCLVIIVDAQNIGAIAEQMTTKEINFRLHHQVVFATTDRPSNADGQLDRRSSPYHEVSSDFQDPLYQCFCIISSTTMHLVLLGCCRVKYAWLLGSWKKNSTLVKLAE